MHKNHVPTKSELAWFSKSAESLYKSLETMKQEVSSAQEAHKMLVSSYQRQLSELESIQSQIDSSESVIEIKQQYCTAMERELVKMAGIRHPVRQLPAEVLQCIFESACDLSTLEHLENRIITAIRLSHVCCRWRSIAISTPRMWSTFVCRWRIAKRRYPLFGTLYSPESSMLQHTSYFGTWASPVLNPN